MKNFLKIFFFFLSILVLFFLLNLTFYNSQKVSDVAKILVDISRNNLEADFILKNNKLEKIKKFSSWSIFVKNINQIDRIFSDKKDNFLVNKKWETIDINLKKWLFLLDLDDLSKKYKINSLWFELIPKSAWMLFIDTTDESKIFVFSINSISNFIFKSKNNIKLNSYYIFPHNYILFNLKNNTHSRLWKDIFRLKTVTTTWFIKEKLKDNLNLNSFLTWEKLDFFINTFNFIKKDNNKYFELQKKLKNLWSLYLFWEEYIEKHIRYFINPTKKSIYYKQLLFKKIQELYLEKELNSKISMDLINSLKKLKNFDKKSYEDVIQVINGYYKVILKNRNINSRISLENFLPIIKYLNLQKSWVIADLWDLKSKIIKNNNLILSWKISWLDLENKINQNLDYLYILKWLDYWDFNRNYNKLKNYLKTKKNIKNLESLKKYYFLLKNIRENLDDIKVFVFLKNIFFAYDFTWNIDFIKNFNDFVNKYFSRIFIDWNIKFSNELDFRFLESFLYYLEDYLNNFSFWDEDINNLKINENVLSNYLKLNRFIYFDRWNEVLIKTWIFKNRKLLSRILSYFRKNFFEEKRDNQWLLILKWTKYDKNLIKKIKNELSIIFILKDKFVEDVKLNHSEQILLKTYKILHKKFDEYFLALISYDDYAGKYWKENKELLSYKIDKKEKKLWISDIKKYLKKFVWADFSNTKITKVDDNWFLVKHFSVYGWTLSFLINPEAGYTIKDIIIESDINKRDKFKDFSYSLENQEELYNEQKKYSSDQKEKEKYDFAYFFKNKFFTQIVVEKDNSTKDNEDNFTESSYSRNFKLKFLSKNWDLWSISDILSVNYRDVIANNLKRIIIKKAIINKKVGDKDYFWEFSSKYYVDLKENKHYFYDNSWIKMKFYTKNNWKKYYLFNWNSIDIWEKINLDEFRDFISKLFDGISNLSSVYDKIVSNAWENIVIKYVDNKFIINFEKNKEKFEILLNKDRIIRVSKNWETIKRNIKYYDLKF